MPASEVLFLLLVVFGLGVSTTAAGFAARQGMEYLFPTLRKHRWVGGTVGVFASVVIMVMVLYVIITVMVDRRLGFQYIEEFSICLMVAAIGLSIIYIRRYERRRRACIKDRSMAEVYWKRLHYIIWVFLAMFLWIIIFFVSLTIIFPTGL